MEKTVVWNNENIEVNLGNKDGYIKQIEDYFQGYRDEFDTGGHPYPLWEDQPTTTLEDMEVEERKLKEVIDRLFEDDAYLLSFFNFNCKKNGKFKKNGISQVFVVATATDYFTDYTNAWNTLELKLKVLEEDKVELLLVEKVLTY